MFKKGKEKKFEEYVPVLKKDYESWRIKREFREHNPLYTELLSIKDEIAALENRPELAYEEKVRLDAILRNRFASLRASFRRAIRSRFPQWLPLLRKKQRLPYPAAAAQRQATLCQCQLRS